MKEGESRPDKRPKVEFGQSPKLRLRHAEPVSDEADLPLFSGTPQQVVDRPFVPEGHSGEQATLPDIPDTDSDVVHTHDRALRRLVRRDQHADGRGRELRDVLIPYLDVRQLRRLVACGSQNLHEAITGNNPPEEVFMLLEVFAAILYPAAREQITSPHDIAALLMVDMGYLQQEQLRVVCLNTKNQVQNIHIVYQGNLNSAPVRIAEVFREPLRLNSAAIIVAHNHPSGVAEPSPEDVAVTRQLVEAGKLLGCEVLDHVIIGQGRWVSLRERGLGF